ncbi:hypothetical protein BC629DRAFT_1519606, partial [Irpex lacteus]
MVRSASRPRVGSPLDSSATIARLLLSAKHKHVIPHTLEPPHRTVTPPNQPEDLIMSLMLGNLATTIVTEVPVLLERTLNQESENGKLQHECDLLKDCIDEIRARVEGERVKQQRLRVQLLKLRGMPDSRSGSVRELRAAFKPSSLNSSTLSSSVRPPHLSHQHLQI